MALTQTATLPGPSWDEEVVPALRKRLQIESRTLSRRLSGMSLVNGDNLIGQLSSFANASTHEDTLKPARIEDNYKRIGYQPPGPSTFGSSSARVNGAIKPKPVRNRTISNYTPGPMRTKRKPSTSRSPNGTPQPTRIPKVSRITPTSSPHNSPALNHVNGFGQLAVRSSDSINGVPSNSLASRDYPNSSLTNLGEMSRHDSGLLDEPPPFPMASLSSSSRYEALIEALVEAPSRRSNDSEERPFEHWYRGEISRNGGVGELRVGRRQEMLDIANYGHKLAERQREAMARINRATTIDDGRWQRKRAGSVGEIGHSQRNSVYLDEQDTQEMGRVLDECPPTDLDGEGDDCSDVQSAGDHHLSSQRYDATHAYSHVGDISTASEPPLRLPSGSRSSTPTPAALNTPTIQQRNGRSTIQSSSPLQSSPEPRATTSVEIKRGASEPPSSSRPTPSTPRAQRHQVKGMATPTSVQKRAASPTTKAKPKRTNLPKPKKQMAKEEKRRSVAVYPLTAGDEDMADAIPSWTQPKPREGNWDEVVLPVVARKKGLDDHYEQADGSPQPKKVKRMTIEPAPGTFGFKYRTPSSPEEIPMDEFGVTMDDITEVIPAEDKQHSKPARPDPITVEHDDTRLPVRHQPPPSPVPFADYIPAKVASTSTTTQPPRPALRDRPTQRQEDKDSAGCCQCVIM